MPAKKIFSEQEKQYIIKSYKEGKSLRDLSSELGYARQTLSKLLKESEVAIRDNTENSRKYSHNENFFEEIDTEAKAYWLGFIYADGYIQSKVENRSQQVGITLSAVDKGHLLKFKESLEATNPIMDYVGSGYNVDGIFSKILLTSQKTVDDLKRHGVNEQKTYDLQFPDFLRDDLVRHFVRGYFDGDGSINYQERYANKYKAYQIGFTGSLHMIEGINSFFGKKNKICKKGNAYYVNYAGVKQVNDFINIMYEDATLYLDRKYDKVQEFIENMVKARVS